MTLHALIHALRRSASAPCVSPSRRWLFWHLRFLLAYEHPTLVSTAHSLVFYNKGKKLELKAQGSSILTLFVALRPNNRAEQRRENATMDYVTFSFCRNSRSSPPVSRTTLRPYPLPLGNLLTVALILTCRMATIRHFKS